MLEQNQTKKIEVNKSITAKDKELADTIRSRFDALNIKAFDVMGTIGAGKTTLLERIAERLQGKHPVLVINGDLATSIDADRIIKHGAKAIQINTGTGCHLNAHYVDKVLNELPDGLKPYKNGFVFIENVGNLICPAGWDVGAHQRMIVTSVTEGPYHVKKHPHIFKIASIFVVNKIEMAEFMDVTLEDLKSDAINLNKDIQVAFTSLRKAPYTGLDQLLSIMKLDK